MPSDPVTLADLRVHLAWLIWCVDQGYAASEDRANMTNWLLEDPSTLIAEDAALRLHLLVMADQVLEGMGAKREMWCGERHLVDPAKPDPNGMLQIGILDGYLVFEGWTPEYVLIREEDLLEIANQFGYDLHEKEDV